MQLATFGQYTPALARILNVWYSVNDGNWSDPNTWMSNALDKKNILFPRTGDIVYIDHTVSLDISASVSNIYISGKLTSVTGIPSLTVTGDFQASGIVDFTSSSVNVFLYGYNNFMTSFTPGTSTITYIRAGDQNIMPFTYTNLTIDGIGTKYAVANVVVTSQLSTKGLSNSYRGTLELGTFDLTTNAASIQGKLSKTGSGTVNFTGLVSIGGASVGQISFTGNPTVNMSGGMTGDPRDGMNFGSGTLNVLLSQTWSFGAPGVAQDTMGAVSVLIASGKTLTNTGNWLNGGTVNGVDGTSVFNNSGMYVYGNTNTAMATGVFNYNFSGTSTIGVWIGVTMTLPYTSFYNLNIDGTATLAASTTVGNNLTVGGNSNAAILELSTFDLSVTATSSLMGKLSKTGTGTVNLNIVTLNGSATIIAFTANVTVNISGAFTGDARSGLNLGTGVVNLLQNLSLGLFGAGTQASITTNIVIAAGKTITNVGFSSTSGGLQTTGTITGGDSLSTLDNRSIFVYNNATAPMATGKLFCNQAANTFIYGLAGNQDIQVPSDATPGYKNLTLNGSGAKKLLGNVSVKGVYTLTGPATLNTNGFALTNP